VFIEVKDDGGGGD